MIRAALVLAAARAAAPLDDETKKRLDHLHDLLHQAHTKPLPTWTVSHEDADAIDWTPLANGSAKVVETGEYHGIRVVRKRVICTDPITTLARTHKKTTRPLPLLEKHFAEAVADEVGAGVVRLARTALDQSAQVRDVVRGDGLRPAQRNGEAEGQTDLAGRGRRDEA